MTNRFLISRIRAFPQARPSSLRALRSPARRRYATEQSPSPERARKPKTGSGAFYQSFGMPIAKCFLGAIFTYQVVYWSWMKLESLEEKKDTEAEIQQLKEELARLVDRKREAEKAALAEKQEGKEEEKPAKKAWW